MVGEHYNDDLKGNIIYLPMGAVQQGGIVKFVCNPETIEICENGTCHETTVSELFELTYCFQRLKRLSIISPKGK